MQILLTGVTGLLGQAITREAQRRGISILGLARRGAPLAVDMAAPDFISRLDLALKSSPAGIRAVINTAALTNLDLCEKDPALAKRINGAAAGELALWAKKKQIPFIQISTDHFFSGDGRAAHAESAPLKILNVYAESKRIGEEQALAAGALVVRTNIIGWRGWQELTFLEWVCQQLESGVSFTGFTDVFTSAISADQLAIALYDLLQKEPFPTGILHLGSRTISSKADFISALAHRGGYRIDGMILGSVKSLRGAPRAESLGLDVSRAEALLGRPLPTMAEVIEQVWTSRKG